jgi:hypothetical protein
MGPLTAVQHRVADPVTLERFYELEGSGWKGRSGTAIACDSQTREFYDAIARAAADFGYLSLDFLEVESTDG